MGNKKSINMVKFKAKSKKFKNKYPKISQNYKIQITIKV